MKNKLNIKNELDYYLEKKMKKILTIAVIAATMLIGTLAFANTKNETKVQMLPVFSAQTQNSDRLWVGTFQLVWNDFMDNILKGPVIFKNEKSKIAEQLNKQEFTKSMLSEDSYYTAYGRTSLELKEQIEKAIYEKFNEKSELLDKINWNDPNNAYLLYAILKKDFSYTTRFDILDKEKFNNSNKKFNYFGINKKSNASLYNSVNVLFYNSSKDYAVAIKSDKDEVILYRTNSDESFDKVFKTINKKAKNYKGNKTFTAGDQLKVPFMSFKDMTNYDELCNKEIKSKKLKERLYIAQAMQTADFNMTNTGIKLKSEAVMNIMTMSMPMETKAKGRNFYFNKTFYLFMKETGKSMPYFATRVENLDLYEYTKEVQK